MNTNTCAHAVKIEPKDNDRFAICKDCGKRLPRKSKLFLF